MGRPFKCLIIYLIKLLKPYDLTVAEGNKKHDYYAGRLAHWLQATGIPFNKQIENIFTNHRY